MPIRFNRDTMFAWCKGKNSVFQDIADINHHETLNPAKQAHFTPNAVVKLKSQGTGKTIDLCPELQHKTWDQLAKLPNCQYP